MKVLLVLLLAGVAYSDSSLYDFKVNDIQGNQVDFNIFKGKTLLVVNVASQCGQTDSHYKSLKRLYDILSHSKSDFEVLAFPCNDFGEQEPWEHKEIEEFVRGHFKAEFPLFRKVRILAGEGQEPFWNFVIASSGVSPSWNFEKYLFSGEGKFMKWWDSNTAVESIFDAVQEAIQKHTFKKDNINKDEL